MLRCVALNGGLVLLVCPELAFEGVLFRRELLNGAVDEFPLPFERCDLGPRGVPFVDQVGDLERGPFSFEFEGLGL